MRISDWSSDVCSSDLDDLDIGRLEGIEPGQMVAIGWDGADLIAFALGQELMLALRHAVSCPQRVIWAYGQRGVKRHSMCTDLGGAQRLPSISSTDGPCGRRDRKSVGKGKRV